MAKPVIQFFTRHIDEDGKLSWYPIDHFFFAPYVESKETRKVVEVPEVARFEQSGSTIYLTGLTEADAKQFHSVPEALRYFADLIEKTGFVSNYEDDE